ncbi:MAG: complex I NDUFA9 subunit family protein [Ghiorsea sp.]
MMGKRVCIIGGTGFVGRVIARQAVDAGHQVVVASRHPARARDLLVKGIKICKADISTGKGIDSAIAGADTVINLVGLLYSAGKNTFETAHTQGAKNLIDACNKANIKQLLHMSALLSDEATASSKYAQTKRAAETTVRNSGLDWTIFRPSIIFGCNDSFLMRFKSLSAIGPVLPVIAGETKFQPVWVEDVARAFVLSIDNKKVSEQTYTLAGKDIYTFKAMLSMWMEALQRDKPLIAVPGFAASLLATISNFLPIPLITADQLKLLEHDNVTSGTAFPAKFGETSSFVTLLPTLAACGQAESNQNKFDQARTHYRKS